MNEHLWYAKVYGRHTEGTKTTKRQLYLQGAHGHQMKQHIFTCQLQYNQVSLDPYLLTGQLDYKRLSVNLYVYKSQMN